MKFINLRVNWMYNPQGPHAALLHADRNSRAILFTLRPGQTIREQNMPGSPLYVFILKGRGIFTSGNGEEQTVEPNNLLVFDPEEKHTVRALNELVFIGFLYNISEPLIKASPLTRVNG